jgi:hypothetical protein
MSIDPFLISTAVLTVTTAGFWARSAWHKGVAASLDAVTEAQAGDILKLEAQVARYAAEEEKIHAQRVAAAQKAGERSHADAVKRRKRAARKTKAALKSCTIPPRDEVVAGVRAKRSQKSGAGLVASKGG